MKLKSINLAVMALLGSFGLSIPALAANECKIEYGWNTGNSLAGTFENHSKTIYLNKGQTKTINKSRMNYVKNLKTRKVKFYLSSGASDVTLDKDNRNPLVGTYTNTPKLDKVTCLNTSTSSSSNSSVTLTPVQLVQTLKNQGVAVQDIAKQLKNTFNKSKNDIAKLLKGVGFTENQIAGALKSGLSADATQIGSALKAAFSNISLKVGAEVLKGVNFSVSQIMGALKSVFNANIEQTIKAMRDAGFTNQSQLNQVGEAAKQIFNASTDVVAGVLVKVQYPIDRVLKFLIDRMNLLLKSAVKILKTHGVPVIKIVQAIIQANITVTTEDVAAALKFAGWSTKQSMDAMKKGYNLAANEMAKAFRIANFTANQTAEGLQSIYNLSRDQAKAAMQYAGYTANQILTALNKYYGMAEEASKETIKDVQSRIITGQNGFGLATPAVAAAVQELKGWFLKAEINNTRCRVDSVSAIGQPGVLRSTYGWKGLVKDALTSAGMSSSLAAKWDGAYKKAFDDWARFVTIPGLPWYPAFAAWPGAKAPPTPNIPAPLVTLVSKFTPGMAPPNLKKTIASALGMGQSQATADAVSSFATQIGGRFGKFLKTAQVMNVLGSGPVPMYAPPNIPVGSVIGGSCSGKNVLISSAGTF